MIKELSSKDLSVELLCESLEVSRGGYYSWLNRSPSARAINNEIIKQEITQAYYCKSLV